MIAPSHSWGVVSAGRFDVGFFSCSVSATDMAEAAEEGGEETELIDRAEAAAEEGEATELIDRAEVEGLFGRRLSTEFWWHARKLLSP